VWIDDPGRYALTGAHSRFSLPAIAQRVGGLAQDGWHALQHARPQEALHAAGRQLQALEGRLRGSGAGASQRQASSEGWAAAQAGSTAAAPPDGKP
jgi:hypothetical protein